MISKIDKKIKRGIVNIKIDQNEVSDIEMITIISTGSTTHAQGSEPKFRSLQFSKLNISEFIINIPNNKNELQNGTYMVFAVSKSGIPSEGKIIYLK